VVPWNHVSVALPLGRLSASLLPVGVTQLLLSTLPLGVSGTVTDGLRRVPAALLALEGSS
jgi:hypothetical protein